MEDPWTPEQRSHQLKEYLRQGASELSVGIIGDSLTETQRSEGWVAFSTEFKCSACGLTKPCNVNGWGCVEKTTMTGWVDMSALNQEAHADARADAQQSLRLTPCPQCGARDATMLALLAKNRNHRFLIIAGIGAVVLTPIALIAWASKAWEIMAVGLPVIACAVLYFSLVVHLRTRKVIREAPKRIQFQDYRG